MTVTNVELQTQITALDKKVDERHVANTRLLDAMGTKLDTLIQLNADQKLQAQLISQLSKKNEDYDKLFVEVFKRLGWAESTVKTHAWAWKVVGAFLLASIGSIGWMLTKMEEFDHIQNQLDTLEFLVQGKPSPVTPPAQSSSGR
jgi:hypothetical protein